MPDILLINVISSPSSGKISKKYKALTGYSPIQHFIHMKMERACYLLDSGQQPVGEVAERLGYQDAQYFSRLFKKVVGLSPSDYRQLTRG
jgi:AraC-like DNA-binding protein